MPITANSQTRVYSPSGALFCSILYVAEASLLKGTTQLLLAAGLVLVGQAIYLRRLEPASFLIKATLPLAIPLLLIHGILNPQFLSDKSLWGHIPLRSDGFEFAAIIASRLLIVAAAMSVWRFTVGIKVIAFFNNVRLPPALITGIAVAISSIELVHRKSRAVYVAQQARGLNLRNGIISRVFSLPRLIIPIAVATIVEGSERGVAIESRGLGSGGWNLSSWHSPKTGSRLFLEVFSSGFAAIAYFVS